MPKLPHSVIIIITQATDSVTEVIKVGKGELGKTNNIRHFDLIFILNLGSLNPVIIIFSLCMHGSQAKNSYF